MFFRYEQFRGHRSEYQLDDVWGHFIFVEADDPVGADKRIGEITGDKSRNCWGRSAPTTEPFMGTLSLKSYFEYHAKCAWRGQPGGHPQPWRIYVYYKDGTVGTIAPVEE